jgi:hypothetical protein
MKLMAKQSLIDDETVDALWKKAVSIAKANASGAGAKELQQDGVIKARVVRSKDGNLKIEMWADVTKAPMARAQELGSGIHRPKGGRYSPHQLRTGDKAGHILITPRKPGGFLAFKWDVLPKDANGKRIDFFRKRASARASGRDAATESLTERLPSYAGELPDGRSLFNYVHHPGVPPINNKKGYMRIAAQTAFSGSGLSPIAQDAVDKITQGIRVSFAKSKRWRER